MNGKWRGKRIGALLLVFILLAGALSGCTGQKNKGGGQDDTGKGNGAEGDVAKGCYVESDVPMPDLVEDGTEVTVAMMVNPDNRIEIVTVPYSMEQNAFRYVLGEDGWERQEIEAIKEVGGQAYTFTYGPDGLLYFAYAGDTAGIARVSEDGKVEPLDDLEISAEDFVNAIQVLGENEYVIGMYDRTGYWKNGNLLNIAGTLPYAQTGKVMTFSEQGGSVVLSGLEDGEKIKEVAIEGDDGILTGDGENWYLLSRKGIHRMALDGNLWESLVDGNRNSMSKPSCSPEALIKRNDVFYALYQGENGNREIMKYVYDPDMPSEPTESISIVTVDGSEIMQQAAIEFMRTHQDVKVEIRVLRAEDGSATLDDYIQLLNTEVLAGKGADILILDQLPVASYIEKGILEDIGGVMDGLIADGQLSEGIADAYRKDGKIYTMPLRVGIPIYYGKEDAVDAAASPNTLAAKAAEDGTALLGDGLYDWETIFKQLYSLHRDDLFDESGDMKPDAFRTFLEQVKTILDNSNAKAPGEAMGLPADQDQYNMNGAMVYGEGLCKMSYGELRGIIDTILPWELLKKYGGTYGFVNGSFLPSGLVGLNSHSEKKDLAKEFIASLFSVEVQSVNYSDGFSVNPKVWEGLKDYEDDFLIGVMINGEEVDAQMMDKTSLAEFLSHFTELCNPVERDEVFEGMLLEGVQEYFGGTKTVDEAVSMIQDKTKLYLAE